MNSPIIWGALIGAAAPILVLLFDECVIAWRKHKGMWPP